MAGWVSGVCALLLGVGLAVAMVKVKEWWADVGERRFMEIQSDIGGFELPTFGSDGRSTSTTPERPEDEFDSSRNGSVAKSGIGAEAIADKADALARASSTNAGSPRSSRSRLTTDELRVNMGEGAEF